MTDHHQATYATEESLQQALREVYTQMIAQSDMVSQAIEGHRSNTAMVNRTLGLAEQTLSLVQTEQAKVMALTKRVNRLEDRLLYLVLVLLWMIAVVVIGALT